MENNDKVWLNSLYRVMVLPKVILIDLLKLSDSEKIKDNFSSSIPVSLGEIYYFNKFVRDLIIGGMLEEFINPNLLEVIRLDNDIFYKKLSESIPNRTLMFLALDKYFQNEITNWIQDSSNDDLAVYSIGSGLNSMLIRMSEMFPKTKFVDVDLPAMVKLRENLRSFIDYPALIRPSENYSYVSHDITKSGFDFDNGKTNIVIADNLFSYLEQSVLLAFLDDMANSNVKEFIFTIGFRSAGIPSDLSVSEAMYKQLEEQSPWDYIGDYDSENVFRKFLKDKKPEWVIKKIFSPGEVMANLTTDEDAIDSAIDYNDIFIVHLVKRFLN